MHFVFLTDDFKRAVAKLPARIRAFCGEQVVILESDWRDPRLHIKKLREQGGVYSFRITRNYRAQFYFDTEDRIIVFDADHRKDSYRKKRI
jgi:mRNA-degrading endonuclease RelE of RelBE toxin-antitoxin system